MRALALTLTLIVAALHAGFLLLEMFLWERPLGRRIFGTTPEFARASKVLAANQGLYNGFLAAGLARAGRHLPHLTKAPAPPDPVLQGVKS